MTATKTRTDHSRIAFRKRLRALTFVLVFAVLCISLTLAGYANRERRVGVVSPTTPSSTEASSSAAPLSSQEDQIGAEIITIRPHGFEPKEIKCPKGRILLVVDNRSGLDEVSLRLNRVAGGSLRAIRVPREILDWSDVVDLPPGNYVLTEAGHPNWICNITSQ